MNFEQFWAMAEPYVMWVFNFLVSTGMVSAISTLIIKGWQKKHSDQQLGDTIATKVSENIVGKEMMVSLESASKQQLSDIYNMLRSEICKHYEKVEAIGEINVAMAKIMIKFKAATEEEKQELLAAINRMEKIDNKPLTIETETKPVAVEIQAVEEKATDTDNDKLF